MKRLSLLITILLFLSGCHLTQKVTVIKDIEYGSYPPGQGQRKLLLDLYLPSQKKDNPQAAIIYIHGGGWFGYSKQKCPGKQVAQRGFILACINYRYSSESLFPAQIRDVKQAVRWLKINADKYNINPDAIGAWGDSAGGHLSALLGTSSGVKILEKGLPYPDVSTEIQGVVNWYGPTDFTQVSFAFEEDATPEVIKENFHKPWRIYTIAVYKLLGGPVSQRQELAKLANPINYIDANDPPFLIVHGDQDKVVPISQSQLLEKELKSQGVAVEFVKVSGMKHSYKGQNEEPFDPKLIDMALVFFEKYLGN